MTLLKRTNQLWKLYAFVALMALGAGITLFQSFLHRFLEKETVTALVIGGMFLVTGVFAWAYASILCPDCKLKLFWYSITKVGLGSWFTWLTDLESCPQCVQRDETKTPAKKRGGKSMRVRSIIMVMLFLLFCSPSLQAAEKPADREAFAGLKSARVIFDVRVADHEKLVFNLQLMEETFAGIEKRGIKPKMIVAFRGPGVKLLSAAALDEEAVDLFRTLKKKGVRFEACAVAMRVFKGDPTSLIPEVTLVANVFNSLIGYQNKGYAMIAIN